MEDLPATLATRGRTHGDFAHVAKIACRLQAVIHEEGGSLSDVQIIALDMICHKIGRILAGDPNVADHWRDIAGYATLGGRGL